MVKGLIEKGLKHHRAGRIKEAKAIYEQALKVLPRDPDALHLAGLASLQDGEAGRAIELIQRAVEVRPDNPAFHANLAQAYLTQGRVAEAHAAYQCAATLEPANPHFATGAANCLAMQGRVAEAEQLLRSIVQRHPGFALAWFNLGNALRQQGRLPESAECYRHAIALEPAFPDAHNNLGSVLHGLERFDEAEQSYRRYLALQPDSAIGYCNLASVLTDCGRFVEAADVSQRGFERASNADERLELHLARGSALAYQGKLGAALTAFRAAMNLAPDSARALWAYGYALCGAGNPVEGRAWLERSLDLQPDSAESRFGISTVCLSVGDQQAGWRGYEWRPARALLAEKTPDLRRAAGATGDLSGKKILLLPEQGLGDQVFFLRFAQGLESRGAQVSCFTSIKLASILGRVHALGQVMPHDSARPVADVVMPMGSLPYALSQFECSPFRPRGDSQLRRTGAESPRGSGFARLLRVFFPELPASLTLSPLPDQLEAMKQRLASLGPPPYLGITWRGGIPPAEQHGLSWGLHKEIALEGLGAAMSAAGTGTLIALQRGPKPGEIDQLARHAGKPVHDCSALNEELESMLALLALIDDYVGVSNTNMHLRAGVGKTARVLVPVPAEWRWMDVGDESPWFPGFRIYRQKFDGDWGGALNQLAKDLANERNRPFPRRDAPA